MPGTRPGRPTLGLLREHRDGVEHPGDDRACRGRVITCDVGGLSSRLRRALRSHLTRIHLPLLGQGDDFLVAGEVAAVIGADWATHFLA